MQNIFDNRLVRWSLPIIWMGVIFALSAQSQLPNLTPGAPGVEEIGGHFIVFAVLALLWWWALRGAGVRYPAAWAFVIAATYGILDEFHQSFVPHRTPSVSDWLIDVLGAATALVIIQAWHSYLKRKTQEI